MARLGLMVGHVTVNVTRRDTEPAAVTRPAPGHCRPGPGRQT